MRSVVVKAFVVVAISAAVLGAHRPGGESSWEALPPVMTDPNGGGFGWDTPPSGTTGTPDLTDPNGGGFGWDSLSLTA